RVPVWLGALSLFALLELALWRGRQILQALLTPRVRFFWVWPLTPMVAWLLVPFTWRLEALAARVRFDRHPGSSGGLLARRTFVPGAAWEGWLAPGVGWLALLLLAATLLAAWRSPLVRRLVLPFGAVGLVQLGMLTLLNRGNYQPRLIVNLAPLLALAAGAWLPVVALAGLRAGLAVVASVLICAGSSPRRQPPALVTTLSQGFEAAENGDDCRNAARAFPLSRGLLVNRTTGVRAQLCSLWVGMVSRERGTEVVVRGPPRRPGGEVLVLAERPEEVGPL